MIYHEGKIFATQRGYGEFKDGWEFPGGKIENGETPQEALRREIKEELATDVEVGRRIDTIEYDYPEFHLSMDCFWCEIKKESYPFLSTRRQNGLQLMRFIALIGFLPINLLFPRSGIQ